MAVLPAALLVVPQAVRLAAAPLAVRSEVDPWAARYGNGLVHQRRRGSGILVVLGEVAYSQVFLP